MTDFSAFAAEVQQWQRETFPGGTGYGAATHLLEEAKELVDELRLAVADPRRVSEESADVFLLLIAVSGLEGFDLMEAARAKVVKNRARVWEAVPNERGYRKHIESGDA